MPRVVSSRLRPPKDPVRITFDGEEIVAERGEPICAALVAAGKLVVARSPKFHRPRGPSCLRAACDGCLARVDETPNVMTCMTPCDEGTAVVSQNRRRKPKTLSFAQGAALPLTSITAWELLFDRLGA